jgi:HK97 family phage portal protein
MGVFDRFRNNNTQKRSVEVVSSDGQSYDRKDYTGQWASAIGTTKQGHRELSRLKPDPDEATNVSAVAARCIDLIVDSLSSRKLEVTTASGEPVDHYLERLFNESPNGSQSARLFKKAIWHRVYNHGEALVILDRGDSRVEEPKSAHIHYGKARVRLTKPTLYAPQGEIMAFEIKLNDDWLPLAPSEVMWLREMDPSNPWKSRAPMEAALESIGLSRAARGWQAGQLVNGANPNGIVYVGQPESDEDYFLTRDEIEAALTGPSSAGRIATIAGPVKPEWISTSMNAQEVAYLDTLKITDEQIANALGVPLDLVGGQRTYQNLDAAWKILWEGTLLPKLEIIASEINRQLLSDTDFRARFEVASVNALQESQDSLTERMSKAVDGDIITIDEARQRLGFEPLPDGAGEMTITPYKSIYEMPAAGARSIESDMETPGTPENRSESRTEPMEGDSVEQVRVYDVPQYIQDNAARGLRYYEEGLGGDGLTDQTIEEAREMAGGFISEDKVKRMGPWIARHLGDLDASQNNDPDDPNYPGAGLVAHLLWGSGPDKATANRVRRWAERTAEEYRWVTEDGTYSTRGLEPEEIDRILTRLENQAERIVKRMSEAQLRDAKRRLQRGERNQTFPANADSTFNPDAWAERAYEYLIPVITQALETGYEETARALGVELNLDNYVINAADARTKVLVDQVNGTTAQVLQDRLTAAATADRLTVQEYSDVLDKTFDDLSGFRAETIARTEMLGSVNSASRTAAVDSQVPVAREWMATTDGRTRESHSSLDGYRTTSMNDPYPNGLMYPGDPSGSAKETINCRCVELFVTDYSTEGITNE